MIEDVFGKKKKNVEMTDAQREAICYKSKLLNKYFDSYDELVKAEEEYKRANAKKLEEANAKKELATKIEKAYADYEEARKKYYDELTKAHNRYIELKNEFIDKYGSYHFTYKNKEPKVEEDNCTESSINDIIDLWYSLLK